MSEDLEKQFLDAIARDPEDEEARAVYADWLEERGDPRGEYLRLELQLYKLPRRLAELAPAIDLAWLEAIARTFDVLLCEPGVNKISVIKEIRLLTGLGLKDSKDIVDSASLSRPCTVLRRVDRATADRAARQISDAGATFQIVVHIGPRPVPQPVIIRRLVLREVDSTRRLDAIKLVREATGLNMMDAKNLVERVIAGRAETLSHAMPEARATDLANRFASVGNATVDS